MLKKKKLNKAILDCDTRWNSIYDMLHRLYELKPFCELIAGDISELELNNDDWELIKSLVKISLTFKLYCLFLILIII